MKNNEREHFDNLAKTKGYAWWGSKTYSGKVRKKVRAKMAKKYLGDFKNAIILEIGCASGDYARSLAEEFFGNKIIATDISTGQIEIAKRESGRENIEFKVGDCENISLPENSVDYIIANSILHHVEVGKCLKECYRVLKNNGQVFFTEPNMLNPQVFIEKTVPLIGVIAGNSADERAFYRWQIKKQLENTGFKNSQVKNFDFLHPATPKFLTRIVNILSRILEYTPLIKEISGSLIITAQK